VATYERKVKSHLKAAGWAKIRQGRSSHEQWENADRTGLVITVPSKIKSRHTANNILKQAGIDKKL
jgi:predicted RNA binding protein YcfA (HicA-like mRNA interferase family)